MSRESKIALSCFSCALFAITTACGKHAAAPAGADEAASCRQFAQSFLDWYVPLTQTAVNGPASDVVLKRKADVLDPDLFKALMEDSEAQARAKGDIVGIDFDPFLGSQDPASRYQARGGTSHGGRCSVEVWDASAAGKTENTGKPNVIAELAGGNGRWRFLNFRYPDLNSDLLGVLAQLGKDRRNSESKKRN